LIASDSAGKSDPHLVFLRFVLVYVVLLALSAVTGAGLFRTFSYVIALLMLFVLTLRLSNKQGGGLDGMQYVLPLLLYYYGLLGSIAYNFETLDWPVAIKLLLAPLFLMIGARIEAGRSANGSVAVGTWVVFGLIVLLPVVVLAFQLATGVNVFARGAEFSIFANRNNAGLYAVALLGLYTVLARRAPTNILVYVAVGASFGTLGVLFAVILSLMLLIATRGNLIRYAFGLLIAGASMFVLSVNDVWIFARFKPVFGTVQLLIDPRVQFASLSYERLYHYLGTTDLSLAFRIKHWHDLIDILASAPIFNSVFGMGVGASIRLSQAILPPHNDYLRMLFECGIVTFVGFVALLAIMLAKLGRRWETIPFLAIALYLFSENLVDNFLAMAVFYYTGGALLYRLRQKDLASIPSPRTISRIIPSHGNIT
jgi:O-antigen ligase